ncbi:uncharacterized protein LOC112592315, partial [Melanaphis sacchari]|uniref:uncharacterized protein LOC112592315 n=1 Tax=Melanaphis sacchari TaxID=742174 RepID=UPI000DC12D36
MFTTSVLMLLAVIFIKVAASQNENGSQLKETQIYTDYERLEMMHKRIIGMYCPPLGLTDKFNVTVVGADWTWTGGIAYIERHASISPSQLFHLMLRRSQDDGDTNNMDHLRFECLSKNSPLIEEDKGKGWEYVSLYEHTLFEYYSRTKQESGANRQAYRCA